MIDIRYEQRRTNLKGFAAVWKTMKHYRRRYGAILVHLGVILMSVGIIGLEGLQQEMQSQLKIGESLKVGGYQFQYDGLKIHEEEDGIVEIEAIVSITREGNPVVELHPQRQIYTQMGLAVTQPAVKSTLALDLYSILVDWVEEPESVVTLRILVTPLVKWLWIGAGVLAFGTVCAAWPVRKKKETDSLVK